MRESISGHKTGLPKKLLELFNPLPPVETKPAIHRRKPKLPYTGVGQYVDLFAAPGEPQQAPLSSAACHVADPWLPSAPFAELLALQASAVAFRQARLLAS